MPKAADFLFLQISTSFACQTCPAFLSGLLQSYTRKPTFQQSPSLSGLPSPPTAALARPSPLISPCGCSGPQFRVLSTWQACQPLPAASDSGASRGQSPDFTLLVKSLVPTRPQAP